MAFPMSANSPKKKVSPKSLPVKSPPKTLQQRFDTWFLPILFVAIGSSIVWALWRG